MFPKQIYKAYDVRGVYPDELNEDIAFRTGRALAEFIKKTSGKDAPTLAVGYDMRLSSPVLKTEVIKGITAQGAKALEVGLSSTPTFYFAVGYYNCDGGIQVSASHNPAQYNGFKMTRQNALAIGENTGIMEIRDLAEKNEFVAASQAGQTETGKGILSIQVKEALKQVDIQKIKPLKIVIDTANSMGGPMMEVLFAFLPCELIKLNFELDGSFPAHEADPLKDENNRQLQKAVLDNKADLGIALDGDADRVFFIDETGRTIESSIIRGILAKIYLADHPNATICYDIRPGKITEDMILQYGGKPIVTRVGHSLIKAKALEVGAVFAGESSGHYFAQGAYGFFEMPMTMILKLLVEWSAAKSVGDYVNPLRKYWQSGEINFLVSDKLAVFERLRAKYSERLKYDFDGLSFDLGDWWFNIRPSNTENKVRLNVEGTNQALVEQKTKEVSEIIEKKI
ncbi:MAG: phosphomannomutase/phosphoglucomutase [Candidatus Magasanikbacteria bacterium CG10_big_fil_rev_8_21_14_0_10_40_10]|uniref:Phosphomannomutase/phosphoglucomutase n=1 Tax=Candidatus Magasanikbacteria bacterium CG10_big_fil_rev_8_21_14_0_10_40_10 TaxID=1974648 RepID=A0A2M6W4D1_9BACT|nr:MAG: phosphomannomutase/phosphoglucomutase [Candidatus Magasanikbacteria bacterium CG10_big_fil_rev_8_21_14_0_10_40_10]